MPSQNRRKLRLINPRSPLSTISMPGIIQRMTFSRKAVFMPLNLAICAAVVPDGWDVEIVDENTSEDAHVPDASGIDAVGIGAMTTQATRAYELADAYRKLGVKVILGGIHPSALPDEAMQHADIVCRGDAEATLPRALQDIAAGRAQKLYDWTDQPDAPIASPRKDLLDPADYLVFNPIQTTRGCLHNCTFCTTPSIFGRRYRRRSIDDIVEEIRSAKEQFGTRTFIFSDDNVAGSPGWAMDLFDALRELDIRWASQCDILVARNRKLLEAMRASGCTGLLLGLESPRAGTLKEAGKRFVSADLYEEYIRTIQSYGIGLWGSFIFGFDSDDWRDCMATVRFAQRMKLAMGLFVILTPYPGTAIFRQYKDQGRILTEDWAKYNGSTVCYQPRNMSIDQLRHAQQAAMYEFYSPASSLRRLGLLPFKKHSWLANLAVHQGMRYYYSRNARTFPHFTDQAAVDADHRIARCLGPG
ncbi:MAG: B12-binding domain-containing radical SAM protein [Phycisphaerae bacterium]